MHYQNSVGTFHVSEHQAAPGTSLGRNCMSLLKNTLPADSRVVWVLGVCVCGGSISVRGTTLNGVHFVPL